MHKRRKADITLTSDQKRIVWQIKTHGPAARSALATDLDMHNASVTRLARELLLVGCLDEQNGQLVGRGRPVVPLTLSGRAGYSAGAMAHPGWLELVLVDFAGAVIARHHQPFSSADPRVFIELVSVRLRELALENNVMRSRFLGLGVAIAGPVTQVSSSHRWTVKWLEGWREVEHPQFFEDYLGVPVWVENESKLSTPLGSCDFAPIAGGFDSGVKLSCTNGRTVQVRADDDAITGRLRLFLNNRLISDNAYDTDTGALLSQGEARSH